jgi:hypothetical protein
MLSFMGLTDPADLGVWFTPILDFLQTLWLWLLNLIDAYVFDLGQLPGQGIAFG